MTAIFILSLRSLPAGKTQLEFDQGLSCLPEQATRPLVEVFQTLFTKGLHFYLKGEKSCCTNPGPVKRFCWTSTTQHQHGNRKSTEFRTSHQAIAGLWSPVSWYSTRISSKAVTYCLSKVKVKLLLFLSTWVLRGSASNCFVFRAIHPGVLIPKGHHQVLKELSYFIINQPPRWGVHIAREKHHRASAY